MALADATDTWLAKLIALLIVGNGRVPLLNELAVDAKLEAVLSKDPLLLIAGLTPPIALNPESIASPTLPPICFKPCATGPVLRLLIPGTLNLSNGFCPLKISFPICPNSALAIALKSPFLKLLNALLALTTAL